MGTHITRENQSRQRATSKVIVGCGCYTTTRGGRSEAPEAPWKSLEAPGKWGFLGRLRLCRCPDPRSSGPIPATTPTVELGLYRTDSHVSCLIYLLLISILTPCQISLSRIPSESKDRSMRGGLLFSIPLLPPTPVKKYKSSLVWRKLLELFLEFQLKWHGRFHGVWLIVQRWHSDCEENPPLATRRLFHPARWRKRRSLARGQRHKETKSDCVCRSITLHNSQRGLPSDGAYHPPLLLNMHEPQRTPSQHFA